MLAPLIPGRDPLSGDPGVWIDFAGFTVKFGLLLDPLSMLMAMIVTGVGGLIHVYATGYMADDREYPRFFTYFNLFIFMMLLLVLGENFLLLFVGWEGVGTCSYLLISFWYTDTNNAKAETRRSSSTASATLASLWASWRSGACSARSPSSNRERKDTG